MTGISTCVSEREKNQKMNCEILNAEMSNGNVTEVISKQSMELLLLSIAVALAAGLIMSRIIKPLKFPAVTGYLIAGILIGPYVLGQIPGLHDVITSDFVSSLSVVSDVALGFIAFSIGSEFKMSVLKKVGKQAVVVALFEALFAVFLVDAALVGLHFLIPDKLPISAALTLGAIASATAPAATMMVVKQYKAKGKVTEVLLPVVALDDAIGLIAFAVSFGVAQALESSDGINIISVVVNPLAQILFSFMLGGALGLLLNFAEKLFKSNSKRLCLAVAFVFLTISLSIAAEHGNWQIGGVEIRFSSLLTCMMLGTVFCNVCKNSPEIMEKTDKWTMPIYILFFVLSGADLRFDFFRDPVYILIGLVYILVRVLGKYSGARVGATLSKADTQVRKYLGFTLIPQAGVALGMSLMAVSAFPGDEGVIIRNTVLFGVLLYELVGPMITKIALTKSGDIVPKASVSLSTAPDRITDDDEDD